MSKRTPRNLPRPTRLAADGTPRWHIAIPLDEQQMTRLEIYCITHRTTRSDAIRQLINDHLPITSDAN